MIKSDRPTTVVQALFNMSKKQWADMARDVFGCNSPHALSTTYMDLETVFSKVIETDTVSNLNSPVEVWIDEDGYYTVYVY